MSDPSDAAPRAAALPDVEGCTRECLDCMTYALLALTAFGAQALLLVPVVPLLLSAGALAAQGQLDPVLAVLALTIGVVPGDAVWFALGRARGGPILNGICRVSMEPANCRRRAQDTLLRYGARTLVVGKFVPGLSTVLLPMAGVYGMRTRRFLAYDAAGALLWSSVYVLLGYYSVRQISALLPDASDIDPWMFALAVAVTVPAYFAWRYLRRRWYTRQMRMRRVDVDVLAEMQRAGDEVTVVDVRHPLDIEADPYAIPGALLIPATELRKRRREVPRKAHVVVYCTCPDEYTSVRAAAYLRTHGVRRVRPLRGGFQAWRDGGHPVELRGGVVSPDDRTLNAA